MSVSIYTFYVNIPYENFLSYYKGLAKTVIIETDNGKSMEMDAGHFRAFVTPSGVKGRFRITLGEGNRFESLELIE